MTSLRNYSMMVGTASLDFAVINKTVSAYLAYKWLNCLYFVMKQFTNK